MSPKSEFVAGVKAELPILLGVLPFGLIYGALALQAGIPAAPALGMSSIVFAGSAQFVATQLFGAGTPGAVILLSTFVVNLRHLLYSASVAPYVQRLRPAWKWLLPYLLTDEAYVVSILHYKTGTGEPGKQRTSEPGTVSGEREADRRHWYFLGAGLTLWATWQMSTAAGIFLGARIPESWSLDFALPLTFMALALPAITDRASTAAAVAAGVLAVVAAGAPLKLGLIIAALVGIIAGLIMERT